MIAKQLIVIFGSLAALVRVKAVDHPNVPASSFCYDQTNLTCGPNVWVGYCNAITSKHQSPVNIDTTFDLREMIDNLEGVQFFDFYIYNTENGCRYYVAGKTRYFLNCPAGVKYTQFYKDHYYRSEILHHFYAQNNGHSIQFQKVLNTSELVSDYSISGSWLPGSYKFAQLHFHWGERNWEGSEHAIDYTKFAMELHIVHYKSIYGSMAEAVTSGDPHALAVMAVFFEIGYHNYALDSIVDVANSLRHHSAVTEFPLQLRLDDLYPSDDLEVFATYEGSLTTPTCDEVVLWTVFLKPQTISHEQMNAIRGVLNEENQAVPNYRKLQDWNDRVPKFYVSKMID